MLIRWLTSALGIEKLTLSSEKWANLVEPLVERLEYVRNFPRHLHKYLY